MKKRKFPILFITGIAAIFLLIGVFLFQYTNIYTPTPYESAEVSVDSLDEEVLGVQAGSVKLPVLMYHNIGAVPKRGSASYRNLFVSPSVFEQQMKYLHDQGYKTLTPDEFYTIVVSGKTPKQKSVLITFDDGSRGQYLYAYPILKKYKMTATFFIIAARSPITSKEYKIMSSNGMVIDSHTSTHRDLTKLKKNNDFVYELVTSKKTLEKITKKPIYSLAYPGCVGYKQSYKILQANGYKMAFSCGKSIYQNVKYIYNLSRVHIFNSLSSFKKVLVNGL